MTKKTTKPAKTFFQKTMEAMGVTEANNQVQITVQKKVGETAIETIPIFKEHEKGFTIAVTNINGQPINYAKEGSRWKIHKWEIIRLEFPETDVNGKERKYLIPKGAGTPPFFPPNLLKYYKNKTKRKTLVITEGYKKAFVASLHDIDCVGLVSISCYKDKDTKTLHPDILKLIETCLYENIIILADGDCRNISTKALEEGKDLYSRPAGFFNFVRATKELLKDHIDKYNLHIYFSHVRSENLPSNPKGLDDLIQAVKPAEINKVVTDLHSFSKGEGFYFYKEEITWSVSKIQKYLHLQNVQSFHTFHSEIIQHKVFTFLGTQYKWNDDKSSLDVIVPGEAKLFFRTGDDYYKKILIPNKFGNLDKTFRKRSKQTIIDDHGKQILNFVPKYEDFCVVPDHVNYQEVIHNCFNIYAPFEHVAEEGNCDLSIDYVKHIFGDQYEYGLDYIQLLYQQPTQILPILCLVSRENNTGKSTFAKWMKAIFTQNMAMVGNADMGNDFNSFWASKLIICCEESFIDKKQVIEKIKGLSTGDKITMNAKGKDQVERDFFGKFMLLTNSEENFIYADENDMRYWVRKVNPPKVDNPTLGIDLMDEIPAFLDYLNKRSMKVPKSLTRMWFTKEQIMTDALKKVILANQPTVEREMRKKLRDMFLDFGLEEILLTNKVIWKEFFNKKYEESYIEKVIKEKLKVETYQHPETKKSVTRRYQYPKWDDSYNDGKNTKVVVIVKDVGRPYVFKRDEFLTAEELANHSLSFEVDKIDDLINNIQAEPTNTPAPPEPVEDELPF